MRWTQKRAKTKSALSSCQLDSPVYTHVVSTKRRNVKPSRSSRRRRRSCCSWCWQNPTRNISSPSGYPGSRFLASPDPPTSLDPVATMQTACSCRNSNSPTVALLRDIGWIITIRWITVSKQTSFRSGQIGVTLIQNSLKSMTANVQHPSRPFHHMCCFPQHKFTTADRFAVSN